MSTVRLHFEIPNFAQNADQPLTLKLGTRCFDLRVHSPETLEEAAATNPAIAFMPEEERKRLTHFFDVPQEVFPEDSLLPVRVIAPDADPEICLPALYHYSYYIPDRYRKRRIEENLAAYGPHMHNKLRRYNIPGIDYEQYSLADLAEIHLAAEKILTPWETAKSLLFHHPELASNQAHTASIIMDQHIAPPRSAQYALVENLATCISRQGPATSTGGWAQITDSVDKDGKPLKYEYTIGKFRKDDRVLIYKLSEETERACASPLTGALNSANDDLRLKDQVWSVNQGITAVERDRKTALAVSAENAKSANIWRVTEKTPNHGLAAENNSIHFDDRGWFSIEVDNYYLRTLSAYVQFLDDGGAPIHNPAGWVENLPSIIPDSIREKIETDSKKFITVVPSVNTILGIPMPTNSTKLSFPFPKNAASARLMFGSLGTSRGDDIVDPVGQFLTMIFQMGVPVLFLAVGSCITDSRLFREFVEDKYLLYGSIVVAANVIGFACQNGVIQNTKWVFSVCGNAITGILAKKGMEKLALKLTGIITVDQLEDALPVVGWGLRMAKVAIDIAQLAVSMGELMSSPATLEVDVKRVMDLHLTLKPDPRHGESGHEGTAVWPALSDHYQITVQYQGGTGSILKGEMRHETYGQPLDLISPELPIGGKLQIIAGIYSENGWLCGKWKSDWLDAFPDQGTNTKSITACITEELVPLTQDTQYRHKEKIIYDRRELIHTWQACPPPTATTGDLHCNIGFKTLCKPVDLTFNSGAYQVGYTWRAAGERFLCQNLSVLEKPESRFKISEVGFDVQPYIAYDQFGQKDAKTISPDNFILDTRNGEKHLRRVNLEEEKRGFGLTDPDLKSWGKFSLPSIDTMVVHPNRAVIGVSWNSHKMEILQLPEQPVEDKYAPEAQLVSGQGVRQGLMQGPRLLTVTPDGRILVLETENRRIQAFDTKGNPVPSFLGRHLFTLDADAYAADLNAGRFSEALQQQFKANGLTCLFQLSSSLQDDLNRARLTAKVWNAFAEEGLFLTYDKKNRDDPKVSSYIKVITKGKVWMVIDPNVPRTVIVELSGKDLQVYRILNQMRVDVRYTGKTWVLNDPEADESYYLTLDDRKIQVYRYDSYMPLHNPGNRTDIEYIDMASEAKGFIYVLSYIRPGTKTTDFFLDVYQPDGTFLFRSPDSRLQPSDPQNISAARLVVDIWRNIYTLNFEAMEGAFHNIEPSISHWCPTPPLFSLELKYAKAFESNDIDTIRMAFMQHQIVLSYSMRIKRMSGAGFWHIIDATGYDVIRSGDELQVYRVKS